MKCKNCGANLDSYVTKCIYCGENQISNESRISTNKIKSQNICGFFSKKYVNSNGKNTIESRKICKNENKWENPFFTISFEDQKYYLNLYLSISDNLFTYENFMREIEIDIIYDEKENINFKANYLNFREDSRVDRSKYTKRQLVDYKIQFTENLIYKILNNESTVIKIKDINKKNNEFLILIDLEEKLLIEGFYSCLKNNKIEKGSAYEFASSKMKDQFLIDNGLMANIDKHNDLNQKYSTLSYEEFIFWCETNKEKINYFKKVEQSIKNENKTKANNLKNELKEKEDTLYKWKLNEDTRGGFNSFLTVVLLATIWINFSFKIAFICILIYNLSFFAYSKIKVLKLNKRIKELKQC
jgi:hypothetical protein